MGIQSSWSSERDAYDNNFIGFHGTSCQLKHGPRPSVTGTPQQLFGTSHSCYLWEKDVLLVAGGTVSCLRLTGSSALQPLWIKQHQQLLWQGHHPPLFHTPWAFFSFLIKSRTMMSSTKIRAATKIGSKRLFCFFLMPSDFRSCSVKEAGVCLCC